MHKHQSLVSVFTWGLDKITSKPNTIFVDYDECVIFGDVVDHRVNAALQDRIQRCIAFGVKGKYEYTPSPSERLPDGSYLVDFNVEEILV